MTDDHWLRAIVKYRSEDRMHFSPKGVTGGAWQLAQVFERRASEEPDRFARLGLKFPVDANPIYLERTLAGLTSAAAASELKLQICRKAFAESRGHCGRSIADVLGNIEDPLPGDAIEMLHWLATEHDDPAAELWQQDAGGGQKYYGGDIRGGPASTPRAEEPPSPFGTSSSATPRMSRCFRSTLDRMICDPSASVLSCVAGTLRAVAYHDHPLGMSLFLGLNLA